MSDHHPEPAEEWREPGTLWLSPVRAAAWLELPPATLAARLRVEPEALSPPAPMMQSPLRDLARVLAAILEIQPDHHLAAVWIAQAPIAEFDQRALLDVVAAGRVDDALLYVRTVSDGFSG